MKAFAPYILFIMTCFFPGALYAEEIVISSVGDIMLAGRWQANLRKSSYDHPFELARPYLLQSDISLANLETPIARSGEEFSGKKFRFRAEPPVAAALKRAGISVVTLANNHIMDFGADALAETVLHLDNAGIAHCGAGHTLADARRRAIITAKGKRIAFLGYSLTQPVEFFATRNRPGTAPGHAPLVQADIRAARTEADYVIVSFHWGKEATSDVQQYQITMAHHAIDSGADIVIGHHPHVLQGIERYKQGIIFYSLGNFAFASKSATAQSSALIRFRLDGSRREAEIVPLDVSYRRVGFQPQPLAGRRGAAVITTLNQLSEPFATTIDMSGTRYFIAF